ncbi:MAG: ATP-binding protein [Candidatus Omnitrophota bacterium]
MALNDKLAKAEHFLSKKIGKAITDYGLIKDKDRILVAVSGGKDSLSLLQILQNRKRFVPIDYELVACHVQTDYRCKGCVHTEILERFFRKAGCEFRIKKIKILGMDKKASCFWCSWNRRKALFETAQEMKCSKIAFGHHKDDAVETLLLNLFFNGEFSSMPAILSMFGGKIQIIRPLIYAEESEIRRFAALAKFPENICKCPNSLTSNRHKIKGMVSEIKKVCPHVKTNLFRSMDRIKRDYLP